MLRHVVRAVELRSPDDVEHVNFLVSSELTVCEKPEYGEADGPAVGISVQACVERPLSPLPPLVSAIRAGPLSDGGEPNGEGDGGGESSRSGA